MANENGKWPLPEGWEWTKLGDVCTKPQYGYTSKAAENGVGPKFLRITDLSSGFVDWSTVPYCLTPPKAADKYLLENDDLLVARAGSVGKAYRVIDPPESVFASYLIRFRSQGPAPKYLEYFLQSPGYWRQIEDSTTGVTIPNVNASKLVELSLPLAPLPEQARIVAEIEKQFTRLDTAVAALKRVQAGLARYKASVLKAAVEGRLVPQDPAAEPADRLLRRILAERRAKWEAAELEKMAAKGQTPQNDKWKAKYKEPQGPDTADLPELPVGWVWASMEEISANIVDCLHSTPKFTESGKFCIDTTCIEPARILFEKARFVSEKTYSERVRRLEPREGDILFAREGTIGTAVVVPEDVELCLGQRMMQFRLAESIHPKYVMWAILSPVFEQQWKPKVTGTTAPHVNIRDIRLMAVPVPSLEQQDRIVDELERIFSQIEAAESVVQEDLMRADRLRQAILQKAFRGELV